MRLPIIGHRRKQMRLMEQLYEQYYRRLYLFALAMVGDEEDARDIVSEVMASVWQQWQCDADTTPTKSFLYPATRNRCLDVLRHNKVHERYAAMAAATDSFSTDAEVDEYEERIAMLYEAIGNLPEPDRSIVSCCCLNRLTYKQAASHLGLTEAVVHRRIMRAYKQLRERLPQLMI